MDEISNVTATKEKSALPQEEWEEDEVRVESALRLAELGGADPKAEVAHRHRD
jgi:hypothetical protein